MTPNWWQQLILKLGLDVSRPTTWLPTYEAQQFVSITMGDGSTASMPVAIEYLATAETAEYLRAKYAPGGKIVSVPFLGPGGPTSANPNMREIEWANGVKIIAGLLAVTYTHNPNDPAKADQMCRDIIRAVGAQ